MLITADVFRKIGVFDPDYFYSFEDIDYCLRARRAGFLWPSFPTPSPVMPKAERSAGMRRSGFTLPLATTYCSRVGRRLRTNPVGSMLRMSTIVSLNVPTRCCQHAGGRLSAVFRGTPDYFVGGLAEAARRFEVVRRRWVWLPGDP